jgi:molecular chaperone HtpG
MKKKGYEVLYLKDNVDEFALRMLDEYDGKKFKSVADKDLDLDSEEEKKEMEDKAVSNKDLTDYLKEVLGDKVSSVSITRLVSHPVCLSYEGDVTLEMEKVFRSLKSSAGAPVVAKKVLQINVDHPVFNRLRELFDTDHETLKKYATMLYTQAMLLEGFEVGDLGEYFALVDELLVK